MGLLRVFYRLNRQYFAESDSFIRVSTQTVESGMLIKIVFSKYLERERKIPLHRCNERDIFFTF